MPRSRTAHRPRPTELESGVLALIEQLGPCTRYSVRKALSESLSAYWSGSAGAIYPLLDRFALRGWVEVEEQPFGTRKKRLFGLTDAGRRELRRWLSAPVAAEAVAHNYDPIRTRVFFLGMISTLEQMAFLDDSVAKTVETIERHREELELVHEKESQWEIGGRDGAIRELSARVEWLRELRDAVAEEGKEVQGPYKLLRLLRKGAGRWWKGSST